MRRTFFAAAAAAAFAALSSPAVITADTVPVRYRDATAHALLTLRSMDGRVLANGEQTQAAHGNTVTKRLTFHFTDGSIDDETTEFADAGTLRLIHYHHLQKGAAFPHPLDLTIDAETGHIVVRDLSNPRGAHVDETTLSLPEDLSNGLVTNIVRNVSPTALPISVSYLAATPKLRLVRLVITDGGLDSLSTGGETHRTTHYVVDVRLGGLEGIISSAVRKSLPRSHIWISAGTPAFVRAETALGVDGPMWQIDLTPPFQKGS